MTEETKPIEVAYSEWVPDPASGMLVSIVTRVDTGEIIGKAERLPEQEAE